MNGEIMSEYDNKMQQTEIIEISKKRIDQLKYKNKTATLKLLKSRNKLLRFSESLTELLDDPFDLKIKKELSKILDIHSTENYVLKSNEKMEKIKRDNERLMRKKNILRKAIDQE